MLDSDKPVVIMPNQPSIETTSAPPEIEIDTESEDKAIDRIEELEDSYKAFIKDLNNNGKQLKIINEMINNYQKSSLEKSENMKVLFMGDVFGTKGMEALYKYLPEVKSEHKPNLIFMNGENVDKGFGISEKIYKELMVMGVNVITLGNHSFSKRELTI